MVPDERSHYARREKSHHVQTKSKISIEATIRTAMGHHNRRLRREGHVPANVFGGGVASLPVQIDAANFARMRAKHQTAGLIQLAIAGRPQPEPVLVRHIAYEPASGKIVHVDFLRVKLTELVRARVPLHVIGESPAAKISGGLVLPLAEAIDIEAFPQDLPDSIELNAAKLTTMGMVLHASDVDLPPGVTLRMNPDEPIVKVQPQRGEEAPAVPAQEEAAAAPPETAEA